MTFMSSVFYGVFYGVFSWLTNKYVFHQALDYVFLTLAVMVAHFFGRNWSSE